MNSNIWNSTLLLYLTAILACGAVGLVTPATEAGEIGDITIDLGMQVESVVFLNNGHKVLLLSNRDQRVGFFDIDESSLISTFEYRSGFESASFSDVAIDPNSQYVFLVGQERRAKLPSGILVRLDIKSLEFQTIRFSDQFVSPSVAVSARGQVFIGDLNSATITVVEDYYFDKLSGMVIRRSDLDRNIYLKRGPAIDIGASQDGRFILVSHANQTLISLVALEFNEVVDETGPGGKTIYPLAMVVPYSPRTSVVIADFMENVVFLAEVDNRFQSFTGIKPSHLGLRRKELVDRNNLMSPLLVSAGNNLETIVVANRTDTQAVVFSRVGGALERRNVVTLRNPPDDIDVSPDGQMVAILSAKEASLRVIRNPVEWSTETGVVAGSERIRQAQRMLSALQFPVGSVDGIDGPQTRRAVRIFQQSAGLKPTGTVDQKTLDQIRSVVSEFPLASASAKSAENIAISGRQCEPVDQKLHCKNRIDRYASAPNLFSGYPNSVTEEIICAAPQGLSAQVQIDTYDMTKKEAIYHCTSYHSCAFIRFRGLLAYDSICSDRNSNRFD